MLKCGTISIVGRPNTGKSSLMNYLLGEKVAIVSNKPQTTRERILGVLTDETHQFVFVDTPGLHKPMNKLSETMVKTVYENAADVDISVLVVEAKPNVGKPEKILLDRLKEANVKTILAINKIDSIPINTVLPVIDAYSQIFEFEAIIPISARTGEGCDELLNIIRSNLPENEFIFPADTLTDQTERKLTAEFVREKLLKYLEKEVPHGITTEIERFHERDDGIIDVDICIICEKQNHKGIVIGKGGEMLKKIGEEARSDIERMLNTKVFMTLYVKVSEDWRNKSVDFTY